MFYDFEFPSDLQINDYRIVYIGADKHSLDDHIDYIKLDYDWTSSISYIVASYFIRRVIIIQLSNGIFLPIFMSTSNPDKGAMNIWLQMHSYLRSVASVEHENLLWYLTGL